MNSGRRFLPVITADWMPDGGALSVEMVFGRKGNHTGGPRLVLLRVARHGTKWTELQQLFAVNRRLFKAYVLGEQLDRLWTYKTRDGVARFLVGWLKALRWQRYPRWRNSVTRW